MTLAAAARAGTIQPTTALKRCVHAYATNHPSVGASLFPAAYAEILPLIRRVTIRTLANPQDQEDAQQRATLRIWEQVAAGIEPDLKLVTYHAAIDVWRASSGMGDARTLTPSEHRAATHHDELTERVDSVAEDAGFADAIGRADAGATISTLAAHSDVWGIVARGLAQGFSQAEIAVAIGRHHSTVSRMVGEMRRFLEGEAA